MNTRAKAIARGNDVWGIPWRRYARCQRINIPVQDKYFSGRDIAAMKKAYKEDKGSRLFGDSMPVVHQPPCVNSGELEVENSFYVYPDTPTAHSPAHDGRVYFVISGPLPEGAGPGRRFESIADAEQWVVGKYGGYLKRVTDAEYGGRWAFWVRPLASVGSGDADGGTVRSVPGGGGDAQDA